MLKYLTPGIVKAGTECLSKFPKWEQILFVILASAGIVLFFTASVFISRTKKKKTLDTSFVCFLLAITLTCASLVMLGFSSACL